MPVKPLLDYIARGPFDEIDTPFSATDYLIPALRFYLAGIPDPVIWESAPPKIRISQLSARLRHHGFRVIEPGVDFFTYSPAFHFDVMVTNPPFSLKERWVAQCMSFGRPWALLLPIAALGVRRSSLNIFLSECQVILPPRRVDFTGKKAPWQYVAWFCHGFPELTGSSLIPVDDNGHWDNTQLGVYKPGLTEMPS